MQYLKTPSLKSTTGTHYHDLQIKTTLNKLIAILGKPEAGAETFCNYEWTRNTRAGNVFTIYDRQPGDEINPTAEIKWHIGAHNKTVAQWAYVEITNALEIAGLISYPPITNFDFTQTIAGSDFGFKEVAIIENGLVIGIEYQTWLKHKDGIYKHHQSTRTIF